METFDVVVIGAGPGGYVAAIRCAQLGLSTACVDRWLNADNEPALGGTCLNVGCIPSKALLDSSHHYHNLTHLLPKHGISIDGAKIDIAAMQERKRTIVSTLTRGIGGLFKKNKVTAFCGSARFSTKDTIEITDRDGKVSNTLSAKHIIVATGSTPIDIGAAPLNGTSIVDSEGALEFDAAPKRLGVIGAGVIGLELGSVWGRLGSDVVVLEALENFLAAADRDVAKEAARTFKRQDLDIRLGCKVTSAKMTDNGAVAVTYQDSKGEQSIEVDKLIVAVGRRAYTDGLNPTAAGINVDDRGRIAVDGECRTNVGGIFAIGDVIHGPMLAHKASEEGIAVAELIAGGKPSFGHRTIPWVIYTHPEIAWVGQTEEQLKADGVAFRAGKFPFSASGRAQGAGEIGGFVKIIADEKTDAVLGVHIIGAQASELIAEAVMTMAYYGAAEDLARTVHAHPTLSEATHEAALAVDKRTIHI